MQVPETKSIVRTADDIQTFEEACEYVKRQQEVAGQALDTIKKKGKELIRARFEQGLGASKAVEMPREEHYGESVIKEMARQAHGMHFSTLYKAKQFAEHPRFRKSRARLEQWMTEKEEEKGRITWSYCRNWAAKQLPEKEEEAEESLEEQKDRLLKKAEQEERAADDLDQEADDLEEEVQRRNNPVPDAVHEARGVAERKRQVAEDLRRQVQRLKVEGSGRIESEKYLDHVRSYPCLVCGQQGVDAHHVETGGTGTKGSDLFTIPLCREHHNELHQYGPTYIQQEYGVYPWKGVSYLLAGVLTENALHDDS